MDPVLSLDAISQIKEAMAMVISDGTAKNANIDNDYYGKTGTSQNFRDAWFIGFNDQITIGIWIGNDDNSPTKNISGGSLPAQLFADLTNAI